MGGKGGVGKTGVIVALAEWFSANEIPATLLDLDTENKARGSLKHFFNGTVTKVNIHTPAGLDAFVDHLDGGTPIILADMGVGAGQVAADWFESISVEIAPGDPAWWSRTGSRRRWYRSIRKSPVEVGGCTYSRRTYAASDWHRTGTNHVVQTGSDASYTGWLRKSLQIMPPGMKTPCSSRYRSPLRQMVVDLLLGNLA
jgi:hypothetical protein